MSNEYKDWLIDTKREAEARARVKGMCSRCDPESMFNRIYQDSLTGDWYLEITTNEWDECEHEFVHQREYISYCPFCGRELK